jgi:hypothetical protein
MEGVIEVREDTIEPLVIEGREFPLVEYGRMQPGVKLILSGDDYWYYKTLPLKGYGAVLGRYLRDLEANGSKPLLARFFDRIYIYATNITPIGAGKPPGA